MRKLILFTFLVCTNFLVLDRVNKQSNPNNGLDLLYRWETNQVRILYLYKDIAAKEMRFHPVTNMKDIPIGERWYVENNSYGMMAYMAGIKNDDKKLKEYGVGILDFAMKQQAENAEFPEKNDIHHSLAFFYEMVARFLILSERKGFADGVSPEVLQRLKSGLRKGAIWFAKESSWNDAYWRDYFHHRFLLNASVILLAQRVCGDLPPETLIQAHKWIKTAVERQLSDGKMTENGGHDTGYQSLGITFSVGMLMVSDLSKDERKQLENLVQKGTDWLLTRVSPEGEINGTGNTRMSTISKELNRTDNKPKGIKPYEHAFALYGAASYFKNSLYQKAADHIVKYYKLNIQEIKN